MIEDWWSCQLYFFITFFPYAHQYSFHFFFIIRWMLLNKFSFKNSLKLTFTWIYWTLLYFHLQYLFQIGQNDAHYYSDWLELIKKFHKSNYVWIKTCFWVEKRYFLSLAFFVSSWISINTRFLNRPGSNYSWNIFVLSAIVLKIWCILWRKENLRVFPKITTKPDML